MNTYQLHPTFLVILTILMVLTFPVALAAKQNQNTASSTNSNASSATKESKTDEAGKEAPTAELLTRKAVILEKDSPGYTSRARKNGIQGTVRLRAVLAANGRVENIEVIEGLPDGLTEKAIKAAKKLKFKPAMKDGRPVSQYVTMNFPFSLY